MLPLQRAGPTCRRALLSRSFATPVSDPSVDYSSGQPLVIGAPEKIQNPPPKLVVTRPGRVPTREDHGLYAFFRKKLDPALVGEEKYETLPQDNHKGNDNPRRAWQTRELRLKSFQDLHTLWYVLLRERNLLATQRIEAGRASVADALSPEDNHLVMKSMERLKAVLNERRLAYEGAVKLAEAEQLVQVDRELFKHQKREYAAERGRLIQKKVTLERLRTEKLAELAETSKQPQAMTERAESIVAVETVEVKTSVEPAVEVERAPMPPIGEAKAAVADESLQSSANAALGIFGAVPVEEVEVEVKDEKRGRRR
ncbi:mitochondrial 39-S ribosomal protein L47 (MRP-L47)-domain-containing protein [Mycena floridula]|nr:mitochondrial 39-S ribosomal protein L47 (MRP-L47)-domain-containing protein [Mycena floridula]